MPNLHRPKTTVVRPRAHTLPDVDRTVDDLVQTVFEWWMNDEETDEDGFNKLRDRLYRVMGPRPPKRHRFPECPLCGGRHP